MAETGTEDLAELYEQSLEAERQREGVAEAGNEIDPDGSVSAQAERERAEFIRWRYWLYR